MWLATLRTEKNKRKGREQKRRCTKENEIENRMKKWNRNRKEEGERNNRKVGKWRKRGNTNQKKEKQEQKEKMRKQREAMIFRGGNRRGKDYEEAKWKTCTKENEKEYGMQKPTVMLRKDRKQEKRVRRDKLQKGREEN